MKCWHVIIRPYYGFCPVLPWQAHGGKFTNFTVRPRTSPCSKHILKLTKRWQKPCTLAEYRHTTHYPTDKPPPPAFNFFVGLPAFIEKETLSPTQGSTKKKVQWKAVTSCSYSQKKVCLVFKVTRESTMTFRIIGTLLLCLSMFYLTTLSTAEIIQCQW
jgi:hypothetical protein